MADPWSRSLRSSSNVVPQTKRKALSSSKKVLSEGSLKKTSQKSNSESTELKDASKYLQQDLTTGDLLCDSKVKGKGHSRSASSDNRTSSRLSPKIKSKVSASFESIHHTKSKDSSDESRISPSAKPMTPTSLLRSQQEKPSKKTTGLLSKKSPKLSPKSTLTPSSESITSTSPVRKKRVLSKSPTPDRTRSASPTTSRKSTSSAERDSERSHTRSASSGGRLTGLSSKLSPTVGGRLAGLSSKVSSAVSSESLSNNKKRLAKDQLTKEPHKRSATHSPVPSQEPTFATIKKTKNLSAGKLFGFARETKSSSSKRTFSSSSTSDTESISSEHPTLSRSSTSDSFLAPSSQEGMRRTVSSEILSPRMKKRTLSATKSLNVSRRRSRSELKLSEEGRRQAMKKHFDDEADSDIRGKINSLAGLFTQFFVIILSLKDVKEFQKLNKNFKQFLLNKL